MVITSLVLVFYPFSLHRPCVLNLANFGPCVYHKEKKKCLLQVDDSMFNDEQGTPELPDGLVYFRTNLVELLVDTCQLLRSATFVQKVLDLYLK